MAVAITRAAEPRGNPRPNCALPRMWRGCRGGRLVVMTGRMVEEAEHRLRQLRQDEWSRLALAVLATGLALVASIVHPPLAIPFFLGGLTTGVLALRAVLERSDLVQRLMCDRDAYLIPEIRRHAEAAASMESRRMLAEAVRSRMTPAPGYQLRGRVAAVADELELLACELEDDRLDLDPACAVRCLELVTRYEDSPLLNELLPADEVRVQLRQIRAGFRDPATWPR
jgi:hypothetical protein